MEEILENLIQNEVLYVTAQGTEYLFLNRTEDGGVRYSINQNSKTLPYVTILDALNAFENENAEINANWYQNYNNQEYNDRPCNLSVLKSLINKLE